MISCRAPIVVAPQQRCLTQLRPVLAIRRRAVSARVIMKGPIDSILSFLSHPSRVFTEVISSDHVVDQGASGQWAGVAFLGFAALAAAIVYPMNKRSQQLQDTMREKAQEATMAIKAEIEKRSSAEAMFKGEISRLNATITAARAELEKKHAEVANVQAELTSVQHQVALISSKMAQTCSEKDMAQVRLSESIARISELESLNSSLKLSSSEASTHLQTVVKELASAKLKAEEMHLSLHKAQAEVLELELSRDQLQASRMSLEIAREETVRELAQQQFALHSARTLLEEQVNASSLLKTESEEKVSVAKSEVQELKLQVVALRETEMRAAREVELLRDEMKALKEASKTDQDRLVDMEKQLQQAKQQVELTTLHNKPVEEALENEVVSSILTAIKAKRRSSKSAPSDDTSTSSVIPTKMAVAKSAAQRSPVKKRTSVVADGVGPSADGSVEVVEPKPKTVRRTKKTAAAEVASEVVEAAVPLEVAEPAVKAKAVLPWKKAVKKAE